jgi:GntR family transcriptional regulator, transcriptional repressor for pyruvate dehydrogenase complex
VRSGARPLHNLTVAEAVAAQLRSRILDGDLTDRSELPTENVLLEQFPVSRPSLREAFRILETEGLVVVRRGKRGGTVITHPTPDGAAYHVGLLLHSRQTTLVDLASARNLLEPLCADQAARHHDHAAAGRKLAGLSVLGEDRVEDGVAFTTLAVDFHQELVLAAGNTTLQLLTGILESIWDTQELSWARSAVDEGDYPSVELRREVLQAHRRIAQAIQDGDPDEAARQTRGHLKATSRFVASKGGRVRIVDDYGSPRPGRSR